MTNSTQNFKVGYTKKIGTPGEIIVKATNEKDAIGNAKFNCHTGSDFYLIGLADEKANASNTSQGQNV